MSKLTRSLPALLMALGLLGMPFAAIAAPVLESVEVPTGDARLGEALRLLNDGALDEAETLARAVLADNPGSAPGFETLGAVLALQGELGAAIENLEQAVELNPQQATAFTKLGDIALALGQDSKAVAYFKRAIESVPGDRRAHQRLGLHYERLGDVPRAIEHLELGIAGTPPSYLGVKLNLARLYSLDGQHERNIELLEPWAGDLGSLPEVHRAIGGAYYGAGNQDLAVRHLRATMLLVPDDIRAFRVLGDALAATGDTDLAVTTYRALVERSKAAPFTYNALGALLHGLGRTGQAESVFRELIQRHPGEADGYFHLGSLYGFQRRYDDALEVFQRGLKRQPDSPVLLRGASSAALRAGDADGALRFADRLLEVGPDSALDAFNRGMILEQLAEPETAADAYRQALELAGNYWPAMNNLAVILLNAGETDEALAIAQDAAVIAGEQGNVMHTLGWAQHAKGRLGDAVLTLQKAVALRPESAVTHYRLGRALLDSGDQVAGRDHLRRALAIDADFPQASEARLLLGAE